MGMAFINGFSARCRDCKWFVPDEFHIKNDIHDGTCSNTKHVKTHGGGKGRTNSDDRACFDSEEKEA